MQVSTKLFNDQQVRQFGKLTADIQQKQEKLLQEKPFCALLMTQLPRYSCLQHESKNSYLPDLKKMHIKLRTD